MSWDNTRTRHPCRCHPSEWGPATPPSWGDAVLLPLLFFLPSLIFVAAVVLR